MTTEVADAILNSLVSPNELDNNHEPANVVDVLADLARAAGRLANAVTPGCGIAEDATGGAVGSLTEAVIGVTAGLVKIANAIGDLAAAVREKG